MDNKKAYTAYVINDTDLEQVIGGGIDWDLFSVEVISALSSGKIQPNAAIQELVEAIKAKDMVSVAAKAIALAPTEPEIAMILNKCRT